ncbi:MAG: hypothetical protein HKN08_00390 [Gammaproteobacteria bacterium]|nr:hypothetical protein [Gammaproteobacteria bacterium]
MFFNKLQSILSRIIRVEQSAESGHDGLHVISGDHENLDIIDRLLENMNPDEVEKLKSLLLREKDNLDDEYVRYQIAETLTMAIYPKYKFSEFGKLFLEDREFLDYYEKFMDPDNWHSLDRKYTLKQLLQLVYSLEGDLVESGAYKGASAWLMCKAFDNSDKTIHLFDSFAGLSQPGDKDGDYWEEGALQSSEEILIAGLRQFRNYKVYKGWIPEVFDEYSGNEICFLHIDVDLHEPTFHTLDYFYSRLVTGGVVLMDDYGFKSCPGAKIAADEFFNNKPEKIIFLSTGQGLVIKK